MVLKKSLTVKTKSKVKAKRNKNKAYKLQMIKIS